MMLVQQCWFAFFISYSIIYTTADDMKPINEWLSGNNKIFRAGESNQNIYKFYDGEGVNFTCNRGVAARDYEVRLTFKTQDGKEGSTRYQKMDSVSIYMRLRSDNNNTKIRCQVMKDGFEITPVNIELTLLVHRESEDILYFAVNGLILPGVEDTNSNNYYRYEYKYYDGEKVNLVFDKKNQVHGDVICIGNCSETRIDFSKKPNETFVPSRNSSDRSLECNMSSSLSNTSIAVRVDFVPQEPNYRPFISGLSMSSVLLQYSNDTHNIIEYEVGSETLYLNCDVWSYSDHEVTSDPEVIPRPFKLKTGLKQAIIQCRESSEYKKTTYLKLKQKPSPEYEELAGTNSNSGYIWNISWVLLVLLVLVLFAVMSWRKKKSKKFQKLSISDTSDTSIEQNSVEHLYSKPIPKNQRTKVEPVYAEPTDSVRRTKNQNEVTERLVHNGEPTYASVYNSEPTYANSQNSEPTPSSQHDQVNSHIDSKYSNNKSAVVVDIGNMENDSSNNVTYADMYFENADRSNFIPNETSPYSVIVS